MLGEARQLLASAENRSILEFLALHSAAAKTGRQFADSTQVIRENNMRSSFLIATEYVDARPVRLVLALFLLALLTSLSRVALAESVTLQLKWQHQFQFAGYYAALEKGYYRDAGLDVKLAEATPETDIVEEVTTRRAQYGVGTSALLLERSHGKPVVVLAAIFQHSPLVIIGNIYAGVASVQDLQGKKMMLEKHSEELLAYLRHENVSESSFEVAPHTFQSADLIYGMVDAMSGYSTTEPYEIDKARIPQLILSPRSAGIDFYGDNLFTSEAELREHPERARSFREASLKGWAYAMANPEEIVDLILARYTTRHSREFLLFEAEKMRALIGSDLVAIGYMHRERWQQIINTYADLKLLSPDFPLDGFLYASEPRAVIEQERKKWLAGLAIVLAIGIAAIVVAGLLARLNRRMKAEMAARETAVAGLRESEQRFRFMAENTADVIWILDIASGRFRYVSPSVESLRGYTVEEVMSQPAEAALTPESALRAQSTLADSIAKWQAGDHSNAPRITEVDQPHKDGHIIHTEVVTTLHADADGKVVSVLGVTRNITERKRAEEAIRLMAFYDTLTQLPNRRLLQDRIPQQIARARRDQTRIALLFIDLDKFKPINDQYGHEVGDWLLQSVAQRLRRHLRESDTVARIGGDEFVALLADLQQVEDAIATAEKICEEVQTPFVTPNGTQLAISSSIGVAIYPDDGDNDQALLRIADEAMYLAKRSGRNRVQRLAHWEGAYADQDTADPRPLVRLNWKASFNSGHPLIDAQHRELFALANDMLEKSFARRNDPEPFDRSFDALIEHAIRHFSDEERILAAYGYVHLAEHAAEHRRIVDQANELHRRVRENRDAPGELIDLMLSEVIAGHLLREDRKFFALFEKPADSNGNKSKSIAVSD